MGKWCVAACPYFIEEMELWKNKKGMQKEKVVLK